MKSFQTAKVSNSSITVSFCNNPIIGMIPVIPYRDWKVTEEEKAAPMRAVNQAYYDGLLTTTE